MKVKITKKIAREVSIKLTRGEALELWEYFNDHSSDHESDSKSIDWVLWRKLDEIL